MNRARSGIWAALVGVLALLGCAGGGTGSETNFLPCDTDAECASGVCRAKRCEEANGGAGGRGAGGNRSDAGSGAGGGQSEPTGDGGPGAGGNAAAATLSGIWDAIGTRNGTSTTAQITLSATELTIEWDGTSISARAVDNRFDVTTVGAGSRSTFTTFRDSAGAGETGIVPLPLLGSFRVRDPQGERCTGVVSAETLVGQCNVPVLSGPFGWGPSLEGNVNAVRTEERASAFGVFGGTWNLTTSEGASCSVTISGTTFIAQCVGDGVDGTLHIDVEGDVVTGYTNDGLELSAQRR